MTNTTVPLKTYVSGLSSASSLSGSELFYGIQNSSSVKITTSQIIGSVSVSADQVSNVPTAPISATDVQAALNELASLIPSPGAGTDPLFLVQGLSLIVSLPVVGDGGSATLRETVQVDSHFVAPDSVAPAFSDMLGQFNTMESKVGDATYSNSIQAKTTFSPMYLEHTAYAAGQRFVSIEKIHAYGMSDAFFESRLGEFAGGPIPGDEGVGYTALNAMVQQSAPDTGILGTVIRATGNTTTTQVITAALAQQTVTVADTTNINVNDWYQIQRVIPQSAYNTEAVKIIAVDHGANTITAKFRVNHPNGVTVTPALVINNPFAAPGQLRVVVNRSNTVYTAGQVTGAFGSGALTGNGTTWTANMVGGDSLNIGAISLVKDDWSDTLLRSWFEIQTINAPTQINVYSFSVAGDLSYRSTRGTFPSDYRIRPAVRILYIDFDSNRLICETTTTTWTVGDTVECAVCPYPDMTGATYSMSCYTPGATFRNLLSLTNHGPVPCTVGMGIGGAFSGSDTGYQFETGIGIGGSNIGLNISCLNKAIVIGGTPGNMAISWHNDHMHIDHNTSEGFDFVWSGGSIITANPSTALNSESSLSLVAMNDCYLKLFITGNDFPYILLHDIYMRHSDPSFPLAVDVPTSGKGLNFSGPDLGVHSRFSSLHSYGMGTNGVFEVARRDVTLVNGVNDDILLDPPASFIRIVGPTAPFTISGVIETFGSWGPSTNNCAGDGTELHVYNSAAFAMTIANNAATSNATAGFLTLTGADVILRAGTSAALFKYSSSERRWILISTN